MKRRGASSLGAPTPSCAVRWRDRGFQKSFPARLEAIAQENPGNIEIWFADEARIGQKNKITRRWARRGTRPSAPTDRRTASTYIFGGARFARLQH
jgi:hypothetical protein